MDAQCHTGRGFWHSARADRHPRPESCVAVKYIGAGGFAECSGNLQAYTAGTPSVTLPAAITVGDRSIGHTVDGYYNGMFGYVYSATTGENQSFEIVSYVGATNVATIKTAFPVALSGTMVVRIMDNDRELFYDVAMKIAINTYLTDPTNLDWGKMFDMNGTLNNTNDNPVQDLKTLKKYLDKGKAAYDAISAAVTAIPV